MELGKYSSVSPEIGALFASMQKQIDACIARAAAAEARAAAAEQQVKQKDAEIERLKEIIRKYQCMLFGSRSEKTRYLSTFTQLSLFDVDETAVEGLTAEAAPTPVAGHTRRQKRERNSFIDLMIETGRFPIEDEILDLPEAERFDKDGKPLEYIGKELVRRTVTTSQQEYRVHRLYRKVYGSCRNKETAQRETVVSADVPPAVIPHSPASSSILSDVATKKFDYGTPLYRQEKQLHDAGIPIGRNVLANWILQSSAYIEPVVARMKQELLTQDLIHADETPIRVLHNCKDNPRAKLYVWVYASAKSSPNQVASFEYRASRGGEVPADFFTGYTGCILSDGWSAYNKVKDLARGGCWAHVRRKWFDALPKELKLKESKNDRLIANPEAKVDPGKCAQFRLLLLINQLFGREAQYEKDRLSPAQRLARRQLECKPILDRYWAVVESIDNATGNLLKALTYSRNQKPFLMAFMEHGEIEISNNPVENVIRNFVVGRKNWLFCDTEAGARATALYYSLMVTARSNGLNVFEYVAYVLDTMSQAMNGKRQLSGAEMISLLDELMPWSSQMRGKFESPWPLKKTAV